MAWQAYVDSLKQYYPGGCQACGIFGTNGSTWAQEGLDHSSAHYNELTDVVNLIKDPSPGFANGFMFNGDKYVLIKTDETSLQAKSKAEAKNPLCVEMCNTCMVVMIGGPGSNGGSVSVAVNKMAAYLKENNY
jgi:hypothetical protein